MPLKLLIGLDKFVWNPSLGCTLASIHEITNQYDIARAPSGTKNIFRTEGGLSLRKSLAFFDFEIFADASACLFDA